jgi:hypothetical protein
MSTPNELSDEAKAELKEAVRIVHEDSTWSFIRGKLTPKEVKDEAGKDENDKGPNPPPQKEAPEEKPKRGLWSVGYDEDEEKGKAS